MNVAYNEGRPLQEYENTLNNALQEIGPSESINRFLSKYGNVKTKCVLCFPCPPLHPMAQRKGVTMTPDELVKDNLTCIFKSDATDVGTKRKHTDWLN